MPHYKSPVFTMEFGLPVFPLDRPPEAEGDLMLIIQINWANLPSNCKTHLIMFEVELNPPFFELL